MMRLRNRGDNVTATERRLRQENWRWPSQSHTRCATYRTRRAQPNSGKRQLDWRVALLEGRATDHRLHCVYRTVLYNQTSDKVYSTRETDAATSGKSASYRTDAADFYRRISKTVGRLPTPNLVGAGCVCVAILLGVSIAANVRLALAIVAGALILPVWVLAHFIIPVLLLAPLALSPNVIHRLTGLSDATAIQKLLVLLVLSLAIIIAGRNRQVPIGRLVVLWGLIGVASFFWSNLAPGVDIGTMGRAIVGYTYAWLALQVRWDRLSRTILAQFIAILPLLSLALGAVLDYAEISSVFVREYTGVLRLQGASIPAHLAMLGFVGIAASLWLARRTSFWRYIALLNVAIVLATGTRGASLSSFILITVFLWPSRGGTDRTSRATSVALLVAVVLASASFLPTLLERSATPVHGGLNTSGRLTAWGFYLEEARESLLTGRGVGSASVLAEGADHWQLSHYTVPHNIYLQLVLDAGIAGAILVLITIIHLYYVLKHSMDNYGQRLLMAMATAIIPYAFVDNVLVTPQFIVPFLALVGSMLPADDASVLISKPSLGSSPHRMNMQSGAWK